MKEIKLTLTDTEYEIRPITHDRPIVRAIVVDGDELLFVSVNRDDEFGSASYIETSGGGVEEGEELLTAIHRELGEELGITVEVLTKIGVVEDDYHLIGRHNINHYFLCRVTGKCEKHLTSDEVNRYHLKPLRLSFGEAYSYYENSRNTKIGRLVGNREVPVLKRAEELLNADETL